MGDILPFTLSEVGSAPTLDQEEIDDLMRARHYVPMLDTPADPTIRRLTRASVILIFVVASLVVVLGRL